MMANYLFLSLRSIKRNFSSFVINIIGFAISIACCFVISLHVKTELSFDDFHKKGDRIYRYIPQSDENGQMTQQTWTPTGLAPLLVSSYPGTVEHAVRVNHYDDKPMITQDDKLIGMKDIFIADSSFFQVFSFKLLRGNPATVLNRPLTMVICKTVADINFPNQDPIGKILRYNNKYDIEITGVFEDVPINSHLQFSSIVSFLSLQKFRPDLKDALDDFGTWNYSTYFLVAENVDVTDLERRINDTFFNRYAMGRTRPANDTNDWLQPLAEIHFTKGIKGDGATGDLTYLYMSISLGFVILLISCFNFMNLSTAMAMLRAREVGLRKALGAVRPQLIKQFLSETFVQVLMALTLGFLLVVGMLPLTQRFLGLAIMPLSLIESVILLTVFLIFTTVLAGAYPAFYLSSFDPARVLKGGLTTSGKSGLRDALTVFQFSASLFLLVFTWMVFAQLNFIKNQELGFTKDRILIVYANTEIKNRYEEFRQALISHSSILDVTISNQPMGNLQSYWRYSFPNGERDGSQAVTTLIVTENYLEFMEMKIKEGRQLSSKFSTDRTSAFLVNESFVNEFGLSKPLETVLQVSGDSTRKGLVVGVVQDFHFRPLHIKIAPVVIRIDANNAWMVSIKLSDKNIHQGIGIAEKEWKRFSEGAAFDYAFLDDSLSEGYKREEQASALLISLTLFALIIAGLGLYGLTTFMIMHRRKEIGIRKVLGSTIGQIVKLFSKNVAKLLLLSYIFALPLAWLASHQWLQNFAYKVSISPLILLVSSFIVACFSLFIVSYQSIRGGRENPSEILRSE